MGKRVKKSHKEMASICAKVVDIKSRSDLPTALERVGISSSTYSVYKKTLKDANHEITKIPRGKATRNVKGKVNDLMPTMIPVSGTLIMESGTVTISADGSIIFDGAGTITRT